MALTTKLYGLAIVMTVVITGCLANSLLLARETLSFDGSILRDGTEHLDNANFLNISDLARVRHFYLFPMGKIFFISVIALYAKSAAPVPSLSTSKNIVGVGEIDPESMAALRIGSPLAPPISATAHNARSPN
ncbi:hypothetical protein HJC99_05800 [Candidatus Saccharibacteria bacterium]|nr:hypothetical protein [Candidatus Saccharibacteria bacterium]